MIVKESLVGKMSIFLKREFKGGMEKGKKKEKRKRRRARGGGRGRGGEKNSKTQYSRKRVQNS